MSGYIFVTNIFEYSNFRIYSSHSAPDTTRHAPDTITAQLFPITPQMEQVGTLITIVCFTIMVPLDLYFWFTNGCHIELTMVTIVCTFVVSYSHMGQILQDGNFSQNVVLFLKK